MVSVFGAIWFKVQKGPEVGLGLLHSSGMCFAIVGVRVFARGHEGRD